MSRLAGGRRQHQQQHQYRSKSRENGGASSSNNFLFLNVAFSAVLLFCASTSAFQHVPTTRTATLSTKIVSSSSSLLPLSLSSNNNNDAPVDLSIPYDAAAQLAYLESDKATDYATFKTAYEAEAVASVIAKQPVDLSIPYDAAAQLAFMESDRSTDYATFKAQYESDAIATVTAKRAQKKQKEKKETTTTTPAAAVVVVEDAAGTESSSSDTESSSSNETESSSEEDTTFFAANLDEGGTLSKWKRILSAVPKIEKGTDQNSGKKSWKNGIRIGDDIDRRIASLALPSMLNLAVVPIVNSVDTFWVGRMGNALALAGQGAANQAFFTIYFLVAFLPMITAPLVATAVGSGDTEAAQDAICESLFLSNLLGGIGTLLMVLSPRTVLKLVLSSKTAPAMQYAAPYLRYRSLSMIPALFSATGFSAYRGLLNTVTPLKVSLTTNALNLIADPLFIFRPLKLGFVGAAVATALAECTGGLIYLKLLLKRNLVSFSKMFKPPSMQRLIPLIKGGAAILIRQLTINIAFLTASRRAQGMDPTGVTAAAYGIVMQIYYLGVVIHLAIQSTAAALVPSAKAMSGDQAARKVADRIFFWASITGFAISACQLAALPVLVPLFSTLPEVQEAVKIPAILSSLIHLLNGPVFAGEGVMLGLGTFGALASVTAIGVSAMFAILLSPLGKTLDGILISIAAFSFLQAIGVFVHYIRFGPLRRRGFFSKQQTN